MNLFKSRKQSSVMKRGVELNLLSVYIVLKANKLSNISSSPSTASSCINQVKMTMETKKPQNLKVQFLGFPLLQTDILV